MILFIRTFNHDLPMPERKTELAAGFDLCAAEDATVWPGQTILILTGWAWDAKCSRSTYGRIAPRSGLAVKHGIDVMAGVIDSDYQGEIKVALINHGERNFRIVKGDRIAQLIVESHSNSLISAEEGQRFSAETDRGAGGFGSTGMCDDV